MDRRLVGYSPQVYRESDTTEYTKKCINRYILISYKGTSLIAQLVKNLPAIWFDFWVRRIPWSRKWQPTPVFLPGKSHEQRSLMGYHPWVLET